MSFSAREIRILKLLMEGHLSEQQIADQLHLSKRTIQRTLSDLRYFLQQENIRIESTKDHRITLKGSKDALTRLQSEIEDLSPADLTNIPTRRKMLLFELLKERKPKKLYNYAGRMDVSESTINSDLEAIIPWLNAHHLSLEKRPGFGVIVNGSESSYRSALKSLISENADLVSMIPLIDLADGEFIQRFQSADTMGLINEDILARVASTLASIHSDRLVEMPGAAYSGLVLHIAIAIQRIQAGSYASLNEKVEGLDDDEEMRLAKEIVSRLSKEFEITIPAEEISYIQIHLAGSKASSASLQPAFEESEILELVEQMIKAFDQDLWPRLRNDEALVNGLIVHVMPVLYRIKNGLTIYNPLLEGIQKAYPDIFEKCRKVSKVIEKQTGCVVNDSETGYLATHFGTALERQEEQSRFTRTVKIGVVCASGLGVSRQMQSRLEKRFGSQVRFYSFGKRDLSSSRAYEMDFFVTNIHFENMNIQTVMVNPLIGEDDLVHIQNKIDEFKHQRKPTVENDFMLELDQIGQLSNVIKQALKNFRLIALKEDITFEDLLKTLSVDVSEAENKAIGLENDLWLREKAGSQVMEQYGLILLHAITSSVEQPSVYTFHPVDGGVFTDPYLKQTAYGLMILIPSEDYNTELYTRLFGSISAAVIEDPEFDSIMRSGQEEKIRAKLASILKTRFARYLQKLS